MEGMLDGLVIVHYIDQEAKVCREHTEIIVEPNRTIKRYRKSCRNKPVTIGILLDLKYAAAHYEELVRIASRIKEEFEHKTGLPWSLEIGQYYSSSISLTFIVEMGTINETKILVVKDALKEIENKIRSWYVKTILPYAIATMLDE